MTPEQMMDLIQSQNQLISELNQTISNLNETIEGLKRMMYLPSSEKSKPADGGFTGQLSLFNEAEELADSSVPEPTEEELFKPSAKKNRKPKTSREELYANLPVTQVIYDDKEFNCDSCDSNNWERIGTEVVREVIDIIPAQVKRVQIVRVNYLCKTCETDDIVSIRKSETPTPLLKHSVASPATVAHIMYQKYINGLPLYRQAKDWELLGVFFNRATMANWVITCALEYLLPLYDLMHQRMLERDVLMADETPCQVLKEEGRTPTQKSYMWAFRTGEDGLAPIILYDYQPSRSGKCAAEFLEGFHGYLHTDGYAGYNQVKGITRCGCHAHLRRKFIEAVPKQKSKSVSAPPASKGVVFSDQLFKVERDLAKLTPDERQRERILRSKPIIDEFWQWVDSARPLSGSKFATAITYAKNQRSNLENYLLDGRCSISTNLVENSIRPFVVGRKNFMFHDSVKGANASAVIYSIVETAKANNLNVLTYLTTLLQYLPDHLTKSKGISQLLPWSSKVQEVCGKDK